MESNPSLIRDGIPFRLLLEMEFYSVSNLRQNNSVSDLSLIRDRIFPSLIRDGIETDTIRYQCFKDRKFRL